MRLNLLYTKYTSAAHCMAVVHASVLFSNRVGREMQLTLIDESKQ